MVYISFLFFYCFDLQSQQEIFQGKLNESEFFYFILNFSLCFLCIIFFYFFIFCSYLWGVNIWKWLLLRERKCFSCLFLFFFFILFFFLNFFLLLKKERKQENSVKNTNSICCCIIIMSTCCTCSNKKQKTKCNTTKTKNMLHTHTLSFSNIIFKVKRIPYMTYTKGTEKT